MNYSKVENLRNSEKSKKLFAEKLSMTEHGVLHMLKYKTMTVETLERIALVYNKPIEYFFSEDNQTTISNDEKPSYGKQSCRDCEKTRAKLELAMQLLKEKVVCLACNLLE
ncbi:MAG TPA: hypothetical protein PKE03_10120 [Bacteroidales bacterium]|nr:hypothetical protein [Bacteroidales bacterium]